MNEGPSIATQPVGADYCIDGPSNALEFVLGGNPTGTIQYQWYYNATGSDDPNDPNTTAISAPEGQQATYTPPTDAIGTLYYFCVISFSGSGSCNEIKTIPVAITVHPNIIISDETPLDQTICTGANTDELSITTNNGGAGTLIYNWYYSTDTIIDNTDTLVGSNSNSYNPGVINTSGVYYYYVTIDVDESLGCSDVSSQLFTILVVDDPVVTIAPTNQTICTNTSAEILIAAASGGIDISGDGNIDNADYEFQWYLNGSPVTETNNTDGDDSTFNHDTTLPAGTYSYYCVISQPNDLDCNGTSNTVTITVNEGPSITAQPVGETYCLGDPIQALEVLTINGVGIPSYQWYSNNTNDIDTPNTIGTDSNVLDPPNLVVGTVYYYCVISFNQGGCGDLISEIVEITINQVPQISNFSELICSDNSFLVLPDETNGDIVPANTTYTWSAPIINPVGTIAGTSEALTPQTIISQNLINTSTNPSTVIYTVTPTSGDCIGNDFTVVLTVNPAVSIADPPEILNSPCFGANLGSIDIEIFGGIPFNSGSAYQVSWSGPNGFTSSQEDINNLAPGEYTVSIQDEGGCPYSNTFIIEEPDELVLENIDLQNDISCFGADDGEISVTISGGVEPYVYTWTQDNVVFSNDEDISGLTPGVYQLTVVDNNGCVLNLPPYNILEPTLLTVELQNQINVLCSGENTGSIDIDVIGGRLDYTYSWTGPNGFTSSNEDITDLFAGIYTITVYDNTAPNPCADSLEVIIVENEEITINYTVTEIRCFGDNNASITINSISGGTGNYNVEWSNSGTGMVQVNLSAGNYIITITDDSGCFKNFEIPIDEAPLFLINPEVEQISCSGNNDASIILNLEGGILPVTVDWE